MAEWLIREARKTHPDAVYIVSVNTLGEEGLDDEAERRKALMHQELDVMPFSKEKLEYTKWLADMADLSFKESLEFYIPMIRFHSRWNELKMGNFSKREINSKCARKTETYLKRIYDITPNYIVTEEKTEVSELLIKSLESLLDYCSREGVKILFVTAPRAELEYETIEKYNMVNELITQKGFSVLNMRDEGYQEAGIDFRTDYSDDRHTNIHGSIKFTRYISEYLVSHYGMQNKREDSRYESWEQALSDYCEVISPHIFEHELDKERCDYSIPATEQIKLEQAEDGMLLTWSEAEEADSYVIYGRKNGSWNYLGEAKQCSYADTSEEKSSMYAVISCTEKQGNKLFGNWFYVKNSTGDQ